MTTDGTDTPANSDGMQHVMGDIVVDSDHADVVLGLLPAGMVEVSDTLPALGLTLLTVGDVDAAVAAMAAPSSDFEPRHSTDPLDLLIARLRSASAAASSGWFPTMGKNRIVMGPQAYPYFSPRDDPQDGPEVPAYGLAAPSGVQPGDGTGVVVGVLDTRALRHPDYADAVHFVGSASEITSAEIDDAWQGHATFVTGLVHAHAPDATILVRAVLPGTAGQASAWEAAKGLVNLVQAGADVINMSLGCVTADNRPPFAIRAAVERLRDRVVLVASAGNYDPEDSPATPPSWPAALDGVLAVGSVTARGARSRFSPNEPWVDLVAGGDRVLSTFAIDKEVRYVRRDGSVADVKFNGSAIWSGTSFAAAVVSGRIAALASASGYPTSGLSLQTLAKQLRDHRYPQDSVARWA